MDQYIGKLLDNRYEILERIGSGGMAVVYKARCHRLNRLVAIKILKSDLAQDAEFRRRFHDESQAVAMLSHPNIVAVYDVSHSDDLDYIVMELIDGITLKQYMQKKGEPLNWREALHFITQIMKGLSHAHSRGIIHRDIKPHNIMVLRDGSVKVADFGIARLTSAAQNTLTQEALGSVHYISPEQARGSYIDARSDIYSAGVVLYEMLTCRLPYEGDSPISVAIQHINSIPLSPREINPDIPEALEEITMKAMASNVDQRYISADAMLVDLEEFRKNPSINFDYADVDLLNSSDEPTQVMKTGGTHSASHGAGSAAAAARQAGGSIQGRGAPEPQRRRKSREEDYEEDYDDYDRRSRSEKSSPVPLILAVGAIIIFLAGIGYFLWVSFLGPLLNPDIPLYTTPQVVGMTLEEARNDSDVLENGFTVEIEKTVESEEYPEGEIIEQSPDSGTQVQSGERTIKVTVSGGSASDIKMGNYENKQLNEVKTLLESKGIVVKVEEQASEEVTKDYIISQTPEEGTALKAGDEVTLVVSTGPDLQPITIIDLRGQPLEKAKEWLEQMDLILGTPVEVYDDVQPAGYVVSQDKEPSTEVLPKTIVNLTVSKGPDPNAGATESPDPSESGGETTAPPTESVPPSPSPSTSQPTVQKTIRIELPSDRDLVHVVVTVNGQTQYDDTVDTVFRVITPPLSAPEGTMQAEVCVYLDDQLQSTTYLDFVK